jgi:hypothetical protein
VANRFSFSIKDLLFITTLIAVLLGWYASGRYWQLREIHHVQFIEQVNERTRTQLINNYEKEIIDLRDEIERLRKQVDK